MNGILLINKDKDCTSRDVVNDISYIFKTKKVGHTGTLDPLATGVLVITLGKYTKLCDVLTSTYKEYIATFKLGIETDTLDITGNVLNESIVDLNEEKIISTILSFKKTYLQEVPIFSAVKVKGKKLYEYARNNEDVVLPKKEVTIKEIDVISIEQNSIKIKCLVSKGTYIRSLIRDIGNTLGCGATMTELIRTKQGKFFIEDTYSINDVRNNNYKLLSMEEVLDVEVIDNYENLKLIINGVKIEYISDKEFLLFKKNNKEIALYKKDDKFYRMFLYLGE